MSELFNSGKMVHPQKHVIKRETCLPFFYGFAVLHDVRHTSDKQRGSAPDPFLLLKIKMRYNYENDLRLQSIKHGYDP